MSSGVAARRRFSPQIESLGAWTSPGNSRARWPETVARRQNKHAPTPRDQHSQSWDYTTRNSQIATGNCTRHTRSISRAGPRRISTIFRNCIFVFRLESESRIVNNQWMCMRNNCPKSRFEYLKISSCVVSLIDATIQPLRPILCINEEMHFRN